MQEIGIDLSAATPQKLTQELANDAALLITMGCGDKCPYVPGLRRDDWPLPDPKGRPMDEVRAVRDNIKVRVAGLIRLRDWKRRQRDCSPSYAEAVSRGAISLNRGALLAAGKFALKSSAVCS